MKKKVEEGVSKLEGQESLARINAICVSERRRKVLGWINRKVLQTKDLEEEEDESRKIRG